MHIIECVIGKTKTVTVTFWLFIKTIVNVVGMTKSVTVPCHRFFSFWQFIKTIVSVFCITKTITVTLGCLLRLVSVVGMKRQ